MAGVTWFKVLTDIFSDDKIKILQSMPEGDALLVMWFKVLSQAGKTNDGGYIYLKKNIPYSPAMLSTLFGKSQQLVELAMRTFTEFGMIDIDDSGYVFVTNWEKHQSIDALDKIKEQDRLRSANYRERKRLELSNNHVTVTLPSQPNHATDKELELDKKKKIKKEIKIKDTKIKYAEYVSLLPEEYDKLLQEYGEDMTKECIDILNTYKGSTGKTYKSDYMTMTPKSWVPKRYLEEQERSKLKEVKSGQGIRQGDTTAGIEPFKGKNGILPSKYAADFAQVQ